MIIKNEDIKDILYNLRNEFENEFDDNYKSDYKKQITNEDFNIMMEFLNRFINKANLIIDDKSKEENIILKSYDLVFQDAVKCCLENYDYEKTILNEEEIKKIAYKLIYKNDYIWEILNETIKDEIDNIIKERKNN